MLPLANQLGYDVTIDEFIERLKIIAEFSEHSLFVAELNSTVCGWIHIYLEAPTLLSGAKAEIASFVVDENHRSQGVGKSLLQAAEEWSKEQKISVIRLRTNVKRELALKFYQREGYLLSKTSNLLTKQLDSQ